MILIDYVFWGWYQILDKTIYSLKTSNHGIGPKEHSFFISFLLQGINVWTVFRFVLFEYFEITIDIFGGLIIAFGVFAIGYFLFLKRMRSNEIISKEMNVFKGVISLVLTISYTVLTILLMLELSDYIRYK